MKVYSFIDMEDWMESRLGKITGARLGSIVSKSEPTKDDIIRILEREKIEFKKSAKKEELESLVPPEKMISLLSKVERKIGFYEIAAEHLAVTEEDFDGYVPNETPMERGTRMQKYAVDRFSKETGKKVVEDLVLWSREDEPRIGVSPDGVISETEAVETKCLSSARHLEAWDTQQVPEEYYYQTLQYFIVNDDLQELHVVFYDTRLPAINYFSFTLKRENLLGDISRYLEYQKNVLKEVDSLIATLTF